MKRLTLIQSAEWVELKSPLPKRFIEMLRSGLPPAVRYFDDSRKNWKVFWKHLPEILSFAKKFFDHVDYSALPIDWQMICAGARLDTGTDELIPDGMDSTPFSVLFVAEDAPIEVVKAAYRVLAAVYHPDHGGSNDQMVKLNEAYEKICARKK